MLRLARSNDAGTIDKPAGCPSASLYGSPRSRCFSMNCSPGTGSGCSSRRSWRLLEWAAQHGPCRGFLSNRKPDISSFAPRMTARATNELHNLQSEIRQSASAFRTAGFCFHALILHSLSFYCKLYFVTKGWNGVVSSGDLTNKRSWCSFNICV